MSSQTGFLSLPAELRLKIYDLACFSPVDLVILQDIEHSVDGRGTLAKLIPVPESSLQSHIPWLNLSRACKTLAHEVQSFMSSPSFLNHELSRTWTLDLEVYNTHKQPVIRQVIWRNLPCPPEQLHTVMINVAAREGDSPWTEGGPASLARAVYQIFNHLCHNGPQLVRSQQLQPHIRVRDLVVNVDIGKMTKPPRSGCNVDPRWNYALLLNGFEQISKMGFLFPYVANIQVGGMGEYAEQAYAVDPCGVQSVPGAWRNYGFDWGGG